MTLFGGVITIGHITTLLFVTFLTLILGYALGRIRIKGISLGDAGVFLVALLLGALLFRVDAGGALVLTGGSSAYDYADGLQAVESLGLILFVTSIGLMAGPGFFSNLKRNYKSYALISLVLVTTGGLVAAGCILLGDVIGYGSTIETRDGFVAMVVGILSGAMTSTPAFSAAKASVAPEYMGLVSAGHGIAYLFGVVGIVLFIQMIPRLTHADMEQERARLVPVLSGEKRSAEGLFELDHAGIAPFALAAALGALVGQIRIPLSAQGLGGTCFSLTTTGGCLLAGLLTGHFTRIGRLRLLPPAATLKLLRELGLVFFLVGAGIPGGAEFIAGFDPMYFVYGVFMTCIPLAVGFPFAKRVLKLELLNALGAITGGRTSTPALGALISVSGTEDVASAYAATYPVSLILIVLTSQLLVILF